MMEIALGVMAAICIILAGAIGMVLVRVTDYLIEIERLRDEAGRDL